MQFKQLIEANNQLLLEENFSAYIEHLIQLEDILEKEFVQEVNNCAEGTFAEETDQKKRFFKTIANRFTFKFLCFPSKRQDLCTRLWNLLSFLKAWEDPGLRKQEDRKLRKEITFKGGIDKSFRGSIHAALIAEVNRLQNEVSVFIDKDLAPIHSESKAELINCLTDCIHALKSETPEDIRQTFDKAADAILSFTPPADKFLHGFAMGIGLLAALAVGLATGGFIFLLLSGLGTSVAVAGLAGLAIFSASTYANYGLFSVHSSKFLRALAKSGGITEVIDQQGKRRQLSLRMKCLLVFGAVLSVGVGLSNASLTIMFGMALLATLFPTLPVVLPAILISALVFGMTIGLSLIIFKAWVYLVDIIQTKFSSGKEFLEWFIKEIKALKNLTGTQLLSYLLQVVFTGFALFGLFFICFTGIPSLVPALTLTGSWIVGFAAFFGDLPFTVSTILNFCSGFRQLFSRTEPNTTQETEEGVSTANKQSLLGRIAHGLLLFLNAAGRSIQVFDGKLISAFAAVACFFSALAGTLGKQDDYAKIRRNEATKIIKDSLVECGYKTCGSTDLAENPVYENRSSCVLFPALNITLPSPISETELSPTTVGTRHSI
ncbi:hypothetical protein [Rickettsiella endosymbiont of Rhagonycha lignosa]|uniref:hypothetical protein n=1 Tax=Rickettsiella endosymbiont of Rhagonycha lignosa TaxID=3077937 RepID=UPI00313C3DF2